MQVKQRIKHLPDISIRVIPHKKQRYPTVGDYFKKGGTIQFRISRMRRDHEFLTILHELIEWYLIDRKGVTIKEIDEFDIAYEKNRKKGDDSEPGDDKACPCYEEHQFATKLEEEMAQYLGVNWDNYDEYVNRL